MEYDRKNPTEYEIYQALVGEETRADWDQYILDRADPAKVRLVKGFLTRYDWRELDSYFRSELFVRREF